MPEETEATESAIADNPETSKEVPEGPTYAVKIDGEETQVTLEELQQGYQRQADYTRKTQEVAAERERLQQAEAIVSALEYDPQATLTTLANQFNVNLGAKEPADSYQEPGWNETDPSDQRLQPLEQRIAQQEAKERYQQVQSQVSSLQEKYGEFDKTALLNHAVKNRIPNLEAAYAHWQFNDVKQTADKLTQEQEITQQKRDASVVSSGGSTQAGSESKPTPQITSLRDAFALAKEQLSNN